MTIEQAIKKAIEGGYKRIPSDFSLGFENGYLINYGDCGQVWLEAILLDPQFWQCLGKAMGWQMVREWEGRYWKKYWHRFIDHLAENKSIDSFFKELK